MLTACPSCQRQLKIPEGAMGKQVRCPACGAVFTAEAVPTMEQVQVRPPGPPPPPPEPFAPQAGPPPLPPETVPTVSEPAPFDLFPEEPKERPRRRHYREEDDFEDDLDQLVLREGKDEAGTRAHGGATWLIIAGLFSLGTILLHFVLAIIAVSSAEVPQNIREGMLGLACCSIFLSFPMLFFVFLGAVSLRNMRSSGLIITGCIMAIFLGCLYGLAGLIHLTLLSGIGNAPSRFLVMVLLQVGAYLLGALLNLFGGIRGLVAVSNAGVKQRFARRRRYYD